MTSIAAEMTRVNTANDSAKSLGSSRSVKPRYEIRVRSVRSRRGEKLRWYCKSKAGVQAVRAGRDAADYCTVSCITEMFQEILPLLDSDKSESFGVDPQSPIVICNEVESHAGGYIESHALLWEDPTMSCMLSHFAIAL